MIVQEKKPLSPLKNKGCKSLVICTLLLYPPTQLEGLQYIQFLQAIS